jgi:hypothetical protein
MLIERLCPLLWLPVAALVAAAVAVAVAVTVSVAGTAALMLLLLLCTSGRAGSSVTCLAFTARGDDGGDCTAAPVTAVAAVTAVDATITAVAVAAVGVAVSDAICGGGVPVQRT